MRTPALCIGLLLSCFVSCAATDSPFPNVVLIISDDQAWSDYSFMGHPHIKTPNLDRLASESVTFLRGYTPVPLCRPALSSIVTGLYPHQHGVAGNDPSLPDRGVNPMAARGNEKYARYYDTILRNFQSQPNLVRDLVSRGYQALQTGKWWEGDPKATCGFTQAMTVGVGKGARHGDAGLAIGREGLDPVYHFIDQAKGKPFLVWYAPMLPHTPHNPPDDLLSKYLKVAPGEPTARYWANVEWFDRTCGQLLNYLESAGLKENTIVIYTTDNGWIQDAKAKNQFAPRSKRTAYEGGIRTPIMVRWPARLKPRLEEKYLATNLDIWPTLAGLLGTPQPPGLPGINLADTRALSKRSRIFGEQYAHDIADVAKPAASLEHRWMIDGYWKLIVPQDSAGAASLYDLRSDPWENHDVGPNRGSRVKKMRKMLDAWWDPAK